MAKCCRVTDAQNLENELKNVMCMSASASVSSELDLLRTRWPFLYECIDVPRFADREALIEVASCDGDFESESAGGRGGLYRRAQRSEMVRHRGIRALRELFGSLEDQPPNVRQPLILDVLGGDGLVARVLRHFEAGTSRPQIITSDLAVGMVKAAREHGLPALRQPAQHLVLRDECMDGVLVAYGSHHIPVEDRGIACQEAFRVLRPGGRIVFHDFEEQSPVARWFAEVVGHYSQTGHDFQHFTCHSLTRYLRDAGGFADVSIRPIYDPFIVSGKTPTLARLRLADYLLDMYGLVKLVDRFSSLDALRRVYHMARRIFRYDYQTMGLMPSFGVPRITASRNSDGWQVEMPRVALVGCGTKPLFTPIATTTRNP
jgi:ubiquinone/menaquinone biosynthesis C-methylase UbiE